MVSLLAQHYCCCYLPPTHCSRVVSPQRTRVPMPSEDTVKCMFLGGDGGLNGPLAGAAAATLANSVPAEAQHPLVCSQRATVIEAT